MKRKPGQKSSIFAQKGMRLVRSWESMIVLAESEQPLGAEQIHSRIHESYPFSMSPCSLQTTIEDLKTLQKSGFPVCRVDKNGQRIDEDAQDSIHGKFKYTKWCLFDLERMSQFSTPSTLDVLSLSLCRAIMDTGVGDSFVMGKYISRFLAALQIRLNRQLRGGQDEPHVFHNRILNLSRKYTGKTADYGTWKRISTAIAKNQVLTGEYENRDGEKKQIDVAPLAIWFSNGRSYMLAASLVEQKMLTWRIDRFSNIRHRKSVKPPIISEKDIEQAIMQSFQGYVAEPVDVRLTAAPQIAYLFQEFSYHPSQVITQKPDGSLEVCYRCATGWGFEEWILGFGEWVEVKEPYDLRKRLQERISKLAEIYGTDSN